MCHLWNIIPSDSPPCPIPPDRVYELKYTSYAPPPPRRPRHQGDRQLAGLREDPGPGGPGLRQEVCSADK